MVDIRHASSAELAGFIAENGEKKFRLGQIEEWLWKKGVRNFDAMRNISVGFRQKLQENFTFSSARIETMVQSTDGTAKFIFVLHDGKHIEGVLIPVKTRVTACISSQVGCALKCSFCATGTMGFLRNLDFTEIFDQFVLMNEKAQELYGQPVTNIVYMGMGEPLMNYEPVMRSIELITSPKGQGMSPSRITLSTVGIAPNIRRLADDNFKADLALSLHCADEVKRRRLMPVTEHQNLDLIQDALQYFHLKTGKRITIEYLLLKNWNDSLNDARRLLHFCRPFPVKINLIEYNSTNCGYEKSPDENVARFVEFLETKNLIVHIRRSRGQDIAAACGQLVKEKSTP